jgi:hypothetical protein
MLPCTLQKDLIGNANQIGRTDDVGNVAHSSEMDILEIMFMSILLQVNYFISLNPTCVISLLNYLLIGDLQQTTASELLS